jgi:erythromycin esterase
VGYAGLVRTEQLFSRLRGQLTDRKVKESGELKKNIGLLIDSLQMARQVLENQRVHFQAGGWSQNDLRIVDRSLQNRIDFLQIYYQFKLDQNYVQRFAARDSVMAENIIWLADQIYPGEKIIISAHNYHISRFNERDFVMGEKLAEVYGEDLYAIGLFPGTGSFANNSRKAENMETTGKADDLQQIILQSGLENTFLPIPRKPKRDVDWLFQPITVNNTFINIWGDDQLTLADSFDGLILLRKITPAVYR